VSGDVEEAPREHCERLFFALWPDDSQRERLAHATAKAVTRCGGRPVAVAGLHVTLAFLGSVPVRRIPEVGVVAQRVSDGLAEPLTLSFDHLEHWAKPQVLCAASSEPSSSVAELARSLQKLTLEAGFTPDLRPFREHLTLARKVRYPTQAAPIRPVHWTVGGFALVASRTESAGPVYSIVESYLLYGGRPPAS
jgi:2'-5' RNA ligase